MKYIFKKYQKRELVRDHLHMGGENKDGERIDVTNIYIERAGKPWIGVMGEYHFSRDCAENWYEELAKMKSGGINVVATYLFWIYHEEIEGEFDFTGDRDIRRFIETAGELGLDVVIRIGPWAHGECRNGAFPDWLLKKPYKLRDNNPGYMEKARIWYEHIYEEVKGLFYQDGGNIIAIQFENELVDNAEHIRALKELALKIGFRAPIYTATGWNSVYGAELPVDEVMPVFGAYVDAPWDERLTQLPPTSHYTFDTARNDAAIGGDIINPTRDDGWHLPYERYPYATCELGAGLQPTHHRRVVVSGMDAYVLSLVKLGCGNNLVGYYMYHGGTNKIGKLSSLNESKSTGYPNDYPVLNYDFHTALSQYGEAREQLGMLNILHLFIEDFGKILAPMENVEAVDVARPEDLKSVRYCMRTDGESGFVFFCHYQRLHKMEDCKDVVIDTGTETFPPVDIIGEQAFFLPFHMKIGEEILEYATAQPLCIVGNTYFFVAIDGIRPEYKFENSVSLYAKAGVIYCIQHHDIKIITLTFEEAKYARRLDGKFYIGQKCNLYLSHGKLNTIEEGKYSYKEWKGDTFVNHTIGESIHQAEIHFADVSEPFLPQFSEELSIGGIRQLTWKRVMVTTADGFVEIPYPCDCAQLYADGQLVADIFYYGEHWRVPASMLYQKECYLVMSEMKDDFYREF